MLPKPIRLAGVPVVQDLDVEMPLELLKCNENQGEALDFGPKELEKRRRF